MHIAEVQATKEINGGTLIKLFVPDVYLETQIERQKTSDKAYIEFKLDDKRTITTEQRKKYYATLNDIANHTGHMAENLHDYFKLLYRYFHEDITISMSNCTVTQARDMINILIEFAITRDIPLSDLGINRTDDIDKYLYLCIVNRKCSCCGKKADIHHAIGSTVGMGNDRQKINNVGRYVMALCREHHTEIHKIGEKEFCDKHKVYPLQLDEYAVRKLKL